MRDIVSATRTGKPGREFPKLLTPQTKKANQDEGKLFLDFQVHNNGTLFVAGVGYAIRAEALLSKKSIRDNKEQGIRWCHWLSIGFSRPLELLKEKENLTFFFSHIRG
jgi:hypothetical protein